jgi:hypothetical protein
MAIKGLEASGIFNAEGIGPGGQRTIHPSRVLEAVFTFDRQTEDILGSVDGSCIDQVLATITNSETATLTIDTRDVDSHFLSLLMEETWADSTDWQKPYIATGTTDATGELADANLTGTLSPVTVQVAIAAGTASGLMRHLQVITTGTPTAEQVLVEAGTLTVATANAGATLKYSFKKPSAVETLGYETAVTTMTTMSFEGELCLTDATERIYFRAPSLTRDAGFTLDLKGRGNAQLSYKCATPQGRRRPIQFARELAAA